MRGLGCKEAKKQTPLRQSVSAPVWVYNKREDSAVSFIYAGIRSF